MRASLGRRQVHEDVDDAVQAGVAVVPVDRDLLLDSGDSDPGELETVQ